MWISLSDLGAASSLRRPAELKQALLGDGALRLSCRTRRGELMATDVIMPQMGESIAEGTITKWLKKVGRHRQARRADLRDLDRQGRRRDPVAGRRDSDSRSRCNEGQTVAINTVVARIGEAGEQPAAGCPGAESRRSRPGRRAAQDRPLRLRAPPPPASRPRPRRRRAPRSTRAAARAAAPAPPPSAPASRSAGRRQPRRRPQARARASSRSRSAIRTALVAARAQDRAGERRRHRARSTARASTTA